MSKVRYSNFPNCTISELRLDKNYILAALPENYRLYEHVKYTVSEKTGELLKSSRNHAKGPNDRQDAYLYGHPLGRKKRYRSPADFFPHLMWMATDEGGDPDNCSCKVCAPDEIQVFEKPGKVKPEPASKKEEPTVKREGTPPKAPTVGTNPIVVIPKRTISQDSMKPLVKPSPSPVVVKPPPSPAVPPTPRISTPSLTTPTPLAAARCFEQDQDAQYNKYLFRPGELVWFNKGAAWGLAVIVKRNLFKDQRHQDRPKYLVQPLSHPFNHPPLKIVASEELLRPWLAWSAPGPTHQSLGAGGLSYDTVDWRSVLQGQYGPGDVEVDGSIFGAKAIDESYTLIEPLDNLTTTAGERHFTGMFLGGEKIWIGECIRLRIGQGQDIMVLHDIIEKSRPGFSNSSTVVHLVGDIYTFSTIPYGPGREPPENVHLPSRLRQDLDYRNRATIPTKRTISYWKLVQPQGRLGLAEVKGRWYESSVLLPILRGAADFTRDLRRGEIGDAGYWMNGRGDSSSATGRGDATSGKVGTQKFDRVEAFGRAVPMGTKISRGLDGPPEENIFPMEPGIPGAPMVGTEEGQRGQLQQGVSDGDIDEFMNLDRMEEGYVQQFAEGGAQFYGDPMAR